MATFRVVRAETLSLITNEFSIEDSQALSALLSDEEIKKIFLGLSKGKFPGGDGVTYNFLQGC